MTISRLNGSYIRPSVRPDSREPQPPPPTTRTHLYASSSLRSSGILLMLYITGPRISRPGDVDTSEIYDRTRERRMQFSPSGTFLRFSRETIPTVSASDFCLRSSADRIAANAFLARLAAKCGACCISDPRGSRWRRPRDVNAPPFKIVHVAHSHRRIFCLRSEIS